MGLNNPSNLADSTQAAFDPTFANCTLPAKVALLANTAKVILQANSNRVYAAIFNYSNISITLVLRDVTGISVGNGIILLPYASYEINYDNLYTGKISAICTSSNDVVCFECTKF